MNRYQTILRIVGVTIGITLVINGRAVDTKPPAQHGYEVEVELEVSETGTVEAARIVATEDEFLNGLAQAIAAKMKPAVRTKDGVPVKYRVVAPLMFPVEDDGGPAAQKVPLPQGRVQPMPAYPSYESTVETPGGVILELNINAAGKVSEVRVVRASDPSFAQATVKAVRQWRFVPPVVDDHPVASRVFQSVTFAISGKKPDWRWYVAPRPCLPRYEVRGDYFPATTTVIGR